MHTRHLFLTALVAGGLCIGGVAASATAGAAGPTTGHGSCSLGDNNQGAGASGCAGNVGGFVRLSNAPFDCIEINKGPFRIPEEHC